MKLQSASIKVLHSVDNIPDLVYLGLKIDKLEHSTRRSLENRQKTCYDICRELPSTLYAYNHIDKEQKIHLDELLINSGQIILELIRIYLHVAKQSRSIR